jgi:subtilisin-like proprotein convertase family protein
MNIDPSDDCTFWYTQEYMAATGSFNWHTRIGNFKFANCGVQVNDFSITPVPTTRTIADGTSTTYAINTAKLSGTAESIALTVTGLPAGVTATFNPTSVTAGGSSTLTVTVPAGTAASTSTLTITGTAPSKTHTTTVSLTITNANQPPTVTITSPTNGSTVSGTITVSANATDADGTVASVRFDLPDGTSVTDTAAPFATTFDTTKVANGSAVFKATATDNLGATATATVTVTVNNVNQAPTVTFTSPTNGQTVSGTITVSANATDADGTVASVRFDLPDGTSVTDTTAPFTTTFDTTKVANSSSVVFKATATDNLGATATATVTVTVNNVAANQAPTVTFTSPTNGQTVSGTITVSANATDADGTVASVKFTLPDGTTVTDTTAPFSTTFDTTKVADGSRVFTAVATDNLGATATTSVTVTVANGNADCLNTTFNATGLPLAIPDNNATGITSTIPVVGNGNVAAFTLSLNITHPFRGDLLVTLTSPVGLTATVFNGALNDATDNIVLVNASTTVFNGEVAAGNWKLKVVDRQAQDVGTLNSWSIHIVGNCVHWSGSATPNLPTIDNGTACTSLNVATTGGDSAAAKLDFSGSHSFCSVLRGTLAHNGKTVTAFGTGALNVNGPCTFNVTKLVVPGLTGDSSGTWTFCVIDTDAHGDTGVINTWAVHD